MGFVITSADYEPCRRLAVGLHRGVIDATGVETRQGLQPANGRSPVVAISARSSARLCVALISAAKESLSLSTPRSIAWPALSGVPRFLAIDRLPFSVEAGANSGIEPASAHRCTSTGGSGRVSAPSIPERGSEEGADDRRAKGAAAEPGMVPAPHA